MKFTNLWWIAVKTTLVILMSLQMCILNEKRSYDDGSVWFAIIPFLFMPILISKHIKLSSRNRKVTYTRLWVTNPFSIFSAPVVFYHFLGWCCLISGIVSFIYSQQHELRLDVPLIYAATGLASLVSVYYLMKKQDANLSC